MRGGGQRRVIPVVSDDAGRPARGGRAAGRRRGRRRRHRGRWLHRAVDGARARGGRSVAAHRRARAPRDRVRRERPQRRLVLGAARHEPPRLRRGPWAERRDRRPAGDAGDGRRGRSVHRRRGRRRRLAQGRHRDLRPQRRPGAAPDGRDRRGPGVRLRRRRPAVAVRRRAVGSGPPARHARRRLHAALRGGPPVAPRPRARRRCPCGRRPVAHAHIGGRRRATAARHERRHGARRRDRPGDRGLHGGDGRPPPRGRAAVLVDGRLGAPVARTVGHRRAPWTAHVQRRPPPRDLRPAHRRRPHRVRRSRRAVPLRVADRSRLRRPRGRPADARRDGARAVPAAASRRVPVPLGRTPGGPARLAVGRALRSRCRPRRGGWLRRGRGGHDEPRRTHARRPDPRAPDRPRAPAVGGPPIAAVGARAPALARRQPRPRRGRSRRRGRRRQLLRSPAPAAPRGRSSSPP